MPRHGALTAREPAVAQAASHSPGVRTTWTGSEPEFPGRQFGAGHPGADLRERGLASGGGVVPERRETTVIAGAQPARFDELGGFQDPVPYLVRCLHPWVDRVGHADKDLLPRPGMFGDDA